MRSPRVWEVATQDSGVHTQPNILDNANRPFDRAAFFEGENVVPKFTEGHDSSAIINVRGNLSAHRRIRCLQHGGARGTMKQKRELYN